MNRKRKPQIIIIDDEMPSDYPLLKKLREKYEEENVHLFAKPNEGIDYIEANLSKKMIVLLDIMFNKISLGFKVFEEITNKTSLVSFIIMTGSPEHITHKEYRQLINNHAWYFIQRDDSAKEILKIIEKAEQHILSRVDGALEEWILAHNFFTREQPYLKFADGSTMSLNDVLKEIRLQTKFGLEMQQNILDLAINRLHKETQKLSENNQNTP